MTSLCLSACIAVSHKFATSFICRLVSSAPVRMKHRKIIINQTETLNFLKLCSMYTRYN
jgi:hypothetical protein